MIFITGGIASGKRTYASSCACTHDTPLPCTHAGEIPAADIIYDAQNLVSGQETDAELHTLVDKLAAKQIVIATEIGAGVVPLEHHERAARETAGRLACALAKRATLVVRMCCGIPTILKQTHEVSR